MYFEHDFDDKNKVFCKRIGFSSGPKDFRLNSPLPLGGVYFGYVPGSRAPYRDFFTINFFLDALSKNSQKVDDDQNTKF